MHYDDTLKHLVKAKQSLRAYADSLKDEDKQKKENYSALRKEVLILWHTLEKHFFVFEKIKNSKENFQNQAQRNIDELEKTEEKTPAIIESQSSA